jgi:glycosyltransferase involved in cell wall biosynthesis
MARNRKRRVLIVAYHVPPIQGGSGVHRMLSLARYLPEHDWQPTILTVSPLAYPIAFSENEDLLPHDTRIVRCPALDAQRHLSVRGKYLQSLALPDRWRSWAWSGVVRGMQIIRKERPDVIMSTFPIASANLIAIELHRRTEIPWVADLRDPMVMDDYPSPGKVRSHYEAIETSTLAEAAKVIVTTEGSASIYMDRYKDSARSKVFVIENGFEESMFEGRRVADKKENAQDKLVMLHSGYVYDQDRDPRSIFSALSTLASAGEISHEDFELIFRASGRDEFVLDAARKFGVESLVSVKPTISYLKALDEMLESDSLLILQSISCRNQIPAKAYEYLRCRKPIIALTDPESDTGRLLRNHGVEDIAALEDYERVADVLSRHLQRLRSGSFKPEPLSRLRGLSRRSRVADFAEVLNAVVQS